MDSAERFRELDELERVYAPQELPAEEQTRMQADESATHSDSNEPPAPGPVANLGTSSNAEMAPLHIGPVESRDVEDDSTASANDPTPPG